MISTRVGARARRGLAGCLVALALAVSGCPKQGGTGTLSPELQKWAPPAATVEYTRINMAGEMPLPDTRIREEWQGPVLDGELLVYDVATWDVTGGAEPLLRETVRHGYGPKGYGYVGTIDENGVLEPWVPMEIVLPPHPKVGKKWKDTHVKGQVTSVRSCEIMASNFCDGIVVVCDSARSGGRIVLRDHYCRGQGWSGFEALVVLKPKPNVRMWSEQVVRDGVALPEPPPASGSYSLPPEVTIEPPPAPVP